MTANSMRNVGDERDDATSESAESPWYSELRDRWRPERVRLLLVGESAPDDRGDPANRRFFYSEPLARHDNLFRGVIHALYGEAPLKAADCDKGAWLARLKQDGVFLIDLVPYPVNGETNGERARALRDNVQGCVERASALRPDGVIVCHGPSFAMLDRPLRNAGLNVLHEEAIPFPLGNWREHFVLRFRAAARGVGVHAPMTV